MRRTVIHIGPGKTGTTYLQHALASKRDELARAGWLYPGPNSSQRAEFSSLLGGATPRARQREREGKFNLWDSMVKEIAGFDGSVLLSYEILAGCTPEQIQILLGALGRDRVDIVVTVRDIARILPAAVQQGYKEGQTHSATEFYQSLADNRDDTSGDCWWWRALKFPTLVERWSSVRQVQSVTVVVNPAKGATDHLWSRFVAGADLPLDGNDPPVVAAGVANVSLNVHQARLLRYLNMAMEKSGDLSTVEQRDIRWRLVKSMKQDQIWGYNGPQLKMHSWQWRKTVDEWAAQDNPKLAALGVRIIGSLDELRPALGEQLESDPPDPTELPDSEAPLMEAAIDAVIAAYGHLPTGQGRITLRRIARGVKHRILRRVRT